MMSKTGSDPGAGPAPEDVLADGVRAKVERNSRGYNWTLSVALPRRGDARYTDLFEEALTLLETADQQMRQAFGAEATS